MTAFGVKRTFRLTQVIVQLSLSLSGPHKRVIRRSRAWGRACLNLQGMRYRLHPGSQHFMAKCEAQGTVDQHPRNLCLPRVRQAAAVCQLAYFEVLECLIRNTCPEVMCTGVNVFPSLVCRIFSSAYLAPMSAGVWPASSQIMMPPTAIKGESRESPAKTASYKSTSIFASAIFLISRGRGSEMML